MDTVNFENLWVQFFLAVTPSDESNTPTTLGSATCSFRLFNSGAYREWFSLGVLNKSGTEIACLAFTAITKGSYRFSHSALGGTAAHSQ